MCKNEEEKKTVKEVQMQKFSVSSCKSQDFVQSQKNFARSHDHENMTFRNLAYLATTFNSLLLAQNVIS